MGTRLQDELDRLGAAGDDGFAAGYVTALADVRKWAASQDGPTIWALRSFLAEAEAAHPFKEKS